MCVPPVYNNSSPSFAAKLIVFAGGADVLSFVQRHNIMYIVIFQSKVCAIRMPI